MRSIPIRSGTSPDAMPWARFPTLSAGGVYGSFILQSGFFAVQAATIISSLSLLPRDRSHMVRSALLAHEVVAPGAAAGVAPAVAEPAGAEPAGAELAGAAPGGGDSAFFSHPAIVAAA